ncbi:hypothetical protein DEJ28_07525 [Curtobacterium sp. MCPF17_002]|uniref:hypothetical protein n=1 Tax=Curtobacterium sp. MCPF17_002 TaxID=2175645 RepID=UPI000DAA6912|nr:hypothetical protein [Curtobacterium sp. MCPF17_002]WIB78942.1 hypothetical protein DEJ28_07525 [Curtobacterium sp. MCPF17_002]
MPRSTPARLRSVDRTTASFAVLTLAAFGLATTARAAVEWATAGLGSPARYVSAPPSDWGAPDAANAIAAFGACSAGAGVILFGVTLVLAVRRHDARRLPYVLGFCTLAMVIGAVVAGFAAAEQTDYGAAVGLVILRTALAGLAAASLPALVLAALRTHARPAL